MAISNDERRQVAARLRYVAEHGAPEWATSACCIAECLGEDDYPLWSGSEKLFALLADLIEPEPERTCRVERRHVGPLYNVYKFSCCEEEWVESNTDQHASAIDETVCPRCGAKVTE